MHAEKHLTKWVNIAKLLKITLPALVGVNTAGKRVGCFVMRWENPAPEKAITAVDFLRDGDSTAVPVLIGLTAERVHPAPLPLWPASDGSLTVGCASDEGGDVGTAAIVPLSDGGPGPFATRIVFPATRGNGYPAAILFCKPDMKHLMDNNYDYMSFWIRSLDSGMVDITLPQAEHLANRMFSVDLGRSQGKWIHVRANLHTDFILVGKDYDIKDIRREIILYNGRNRAAGFPRKAVTFEITDVVLE